MPCRWLVNTWTNRSAGRVTLNGKIAKCGDRVKTGDLVKLDGKLQQWEIKEQAKQIKPSESLDDRNFMWDTWWRYAADNLSDLIASTFLMLISMLIIHDLWRYVKYWKPGGVTSTSERSDSSNIIKVKPEPYGLFYAKYSCVRHLLSLSGSLALSLSHTRTPLRIPWTALNHEELRLLLASQHHLQQN